MSSAASIASGFASAQPTPAVKHAHPAVHQHQHQYHSQHHYQYQYQYHSQHQNAGTIPSNIEAMFEKIMTVVQKSNAEIAELRQQCAELQMANASLEQMVREGMQNGVNGYHTPPPHSPRLRGKSPFLSAQQIPHVLVPSTVCVPSPYTLSVPVATDREISGFYVVIPAGGAGTRLWPLSREDHPKFLLDVNLCGRSLLQATWDRLLPLATPTRTTVVAGPAHSRAICEQIPDLLADNLFTEPGPKDSMAAIGLAAAILARRDPDAVVGSFAADHMISGNDAFLSAVAEAVEVAKAGYLVTIGIAPSHPATGFGYIRLGQRLGLESAPSARLVGAFKEKPDARTAAQYLATGTYRWNAGMFVSRASFLLELLQEYKPELHEGLMRIAEAWDDEAHRTEILAEVWPAMEKIPIDNAVAEPAAAQGRVAVVPATFGWDDVGDFSSLSEMLPAESNQPKVLGDQRLVLTEQVAGGIVAPMSGRLIACLGVDDLVIVDMPDALMVTTRARSQEVKRLVQRAKEAGWRTVL